VKQSLLSKVICLWRIECISVLHHSVTNDQIWHSWVRISKFEVVRISNVLFLACFWVKILSALEFYLKIESNTESI